MRASLVRRAAVLASAAALVVAAAPARADQPPAFTTAPVVAGPGVVGAPMRVVAQWSGVPAPVALYEWERCDAAGLGCDVIDGACSESYVPTLDDFGRGLAVRVELWNSAGAAAARTPLSDLILGAPTAPVATARASMACTAVASPGPQAPAPVTSTAPSPAAGAPAIARVAYMRPFPIVRIRGYFVRGGARITLLSVRGPPSARVRVACTGAGCNRDCPGRFAFDACSWL